MDHALAEAHEALKRGEVPVGCVLVDSDGTLVAAASNRTNERGNATAHAELVAFAALKRTYAPGSLTLFVTCEPCVMCAAAVVMSGVVGRVVFGCCNPRFGGCGTVRGLDVYGPAGADGRGGWVPSVEAGLREGECVELLERFYRSENPYAPMPKKRRTLAKEGKG